MKKYIFLCFFILLFTRMGLADVITLEGGNIFEGEISSQNSLKIDFKVEGGYVFIPKTTALWKILKIEKRNPTKKESPRLIMFKTSDYDVTFDNKGNYSSDLNDLEKKIGMRVQRVFDMSSNISDKDCMKKVAREFNLPPLIIYEIFIKAALKTGGRL